MLVKENLLDVPWVFGVQASSSPSLVACKNTSGLHSEATKSYSPKDLVNSKRGRTSWKPLKKLINVLTLSPCLCVYTYLIIKLFEICTLA